MFGQIPLPLYCERGVSAALLAEPLNVVSNVGYFIVAWHGWRCLRQSTGRSETEQMFLVGMVGLVGLGSTLFHVVGSRATWLADIIPIGLFMLAYLIVTLRSILRLNKSTCALVVLIFGLGLIVAGRMTCAPSLLPITAAAGMPCLNGSLAYAPAVLGLIGATIMSRLRAPSTTRPLANATVVMVAALAARTVDLELCPVATYGWLRVGSHAIWHVLTAVAIAWLLAARRSVPRVQLTAPQQ